MAPYGEIHHLLTKPPNEFAHPLVRRLTFDDLELLDNAPPLPRQGRGFGGPAGLLGEGFIAGAVDSGRLVATATRERLPNSTLILAWPQGSSIDRSYTRVELRRGQLGLAPGGGEAGV